ncbi:hypothetical protein [Priestia megaterium]|uniref:hypothetical protein n=1 Tax=Priestia megaterium TaxID=1404 RepID=UPI00345807EE
MASNKTPNLGLDVWAEMDYFKRAELNNNFNKIDTSAKQQAEKVSSLVGVNENTFIYTYLSDGSVQSITEKDISGNTLSTTTFTYKTNGDVGTSILVRDGVTTTTQYNYDSNGNLTSTVNTIS